MAIVLAAGVAIGSAASVALAGGSLGVGRDRTLPCASTPLTVVPVLSASAIGSVTVSGLPVGCGTATIRVTADNGLVAGSGAGAVPAGGGAVTVALTPAVALDANVTIDAVMEGP